MFKSCVKSRLALLLAVAVVLIPFCTTSASVFADETQTGEAQNGEIPADTDEVVDDQNIGSGAASRTITITSAADFVAFANSCSIDSYSFALKVVLERDIDLSEVIYTPVPIFAGTFDGGGHTISGLFLDCSGSNIGLFRYLEAGGAIRNLNVCGNVLPSGSAEYVGGIVGENRGTISGCSFDGTVTGESRIGGIAGSNASTGLLSNCSSLGVVIGTHYTGGICGDNSGSVVNCLNYSSVNVSEADVKLDIQDIAWKNILSPENVASRTDTGGIAGYSNGTLTGCVNYGSIGYSHFGYNVGGIVGRQCGYVGSCENHGGVLGRKDVGGIAGQLEPYRSILFSESSAEKLSDGIDNLSDAMDRLIYDASTASSDVSGRMSELNRNFEDVKSNADTVVDGTVGYANGISDSLNELSARISEALDKSVPALDSMGNASSLMSESADGFEAALELLKQSGEYGESAINAVKSVNETLSGASGKLESSMRDISSALTSLNAAIGDPDAMDAAIDELISGVTGIGTYFTNVSDGLSGMTSALTSLGGWITDSPEWNSLFDGLSVAGHSASGIVSSAQNLADALERLRGCVNEDEITAALSGVTSAMDELYSAAGHFGNAVAGLDGDDGIKTLLETALNGALDALNHLAETGDYLAKAVSSLSSIEITGEAKTHLDSADSLIRAANSDVASAVGIISDAVSGGDRSRLGEALSYLQSAAQSFDLAASELESALSLIGSPDYSEAANYISLAVNSARAGLESVRSTINAVSSIISSDSGLDGLENAYTELQLAMNDVKNSASSISQAALHLKNAVNLSDQAGITSALDEAQAALSQLGNALSTAGQSVEQITSACDVIRASGRFGDSIDQINASATVMSDSIRGISEQFLVVQDAAQKITGQFDLGELTNAAALFSSASSSLADAVNIASGTSDELSTALDDLADCVASLSQASGEAAGAVGKLGDAADELTSCFSTLRDLISDISSKPDISFPKLDSDYLDAWHGLSSSLSAALSEITLLSADINDDTQVLLDDLSAVSVEINSILRTVAEAFEDSEQNTALNLTDGVDIADIALDISDEDSGGSGKGKVSGCVNHGDIIGDVNVGGITGSMAIEYDFDPEDDVTTIGSDSMNFKYRIRVVIRDSENRGNITSKKNYCGGVVGRMDMGSVAGCFSEGFIESSGGDYCGGIAGASYATVRGCVSMCSVSGGAFVGGITGYATDCTGNRAVVDIPQYTETAGAIAGSRDDGGSMSENYFVDRGIAAIDGVSYSGIAEPSDYAKFLELASNFGVSETMTLTFAADGKTISTLELSFGDDIGPGEIPAIPQKDGYYSYWEDFDREDVTFSRRIDAVYCEYITSIASETQDGESKPELLAEGLFGADARLIIGETSITQNDGGAKTFSVKLSGENYSPSGLVTLRLLIPDGKGTPVVRKYENGVWKKVGSGVNGSYLVLDEPSSCALDTEVYSVSNERSGLAELLLWSCCGGAALIGLILLIFFRKKRGNNPKRPRNQRKPERNAPKQSENAQTQPAEAQNQTPNAEKARKRPVKRLP